MDPAGDTPRDLAAEKLSAEIQKIELEALKVARETELLLAPDMVRRKAEAEVDKLDREGKYYWMEPIKAIGSLSSIFLAIVAIAGLWVNYLTTQQAGLKSQIEAQRYEREQISSLISDLGSSQALARATAADRLGAYTRVEGHAATAIASLVTALTIEESELVQSSVLRVLEPVGVAARSGLVEARSSLDREIIFLFDRTDPATGRLNAEDAAKVQARQQSLIKITLALALTSDCKSKPCSPDFTGLRSLRRAKFTGYRSILKGAVFDNSVLTEADFFGVDLTGAKFKNALLESTSFKRSILIGATFEGAIMRRISRLDKELPLTNFNEADLSRATFVEACVSGADFTENNVDPADLKNAYTTGLKIEETKMANLQPTQRHDRCN